MANFFHVDAGNLLTMATFVFTLWRFHRDNRQKNDQNIFLLSAMKVDLDKVDLPDMKCKVDIMYKWFEKRIK